MQGLIAHVDTKRAKLEDVLAVPTPERTKTWGVIGHGQLLETLSDAVMDANYNVIGQEYSLSKDGGKLFGCWTLEGNNPDAARMIGFRNSINKTMVVGITAGRKVFVCDNLAFSGEFVTYQKHVGRLTLDLLVDEAYRAIRNVGSQLASFEKWHDGLKNVWLDGRDGEHLMCEAVRMGIMPEGQMGKFWRLYMDKQNDDKPNVRYDNSLYGFHGAITQMWSKNSLVGTGPRHKGLVHLMNLAAESIDRHGEIIDLAPIPIEPEDEGPAF